MKEITSSCDKCFIFSKTDSKPTLKRKSGKLDPFENCILLFNSNQQQGIMFSSFFSVALLYNFFEIRIMYIKEYLLQYEILALASSL